MGYSAIGMYRTGKYMSTISGNDAIEAFNKFVKINRFDPIYILPDKQYFTAHARVKRIQSQYESGALKAPE